MREEGRRLRYDGVTDLRKQGLTDLRSHEIKDGTFGAARAMRACYQMAES